MAKRTTAKRKPKTTREAPRTVPFRVRHDGPINGRPDSDVSVVREEVLGMIREELSKVDTRFLTIFLRNLVEYTTQNAPLLPPPPDADEIEAWRESQKGSRG